MDSPSIVRTASILGFSSALFVSGYAFSASYIVIPSIQKLSSKDSLSIFRYTFEVGATVGVPLNALSALSFLTAAYFAPYNSRTYDNETVRYGVAALSALLTLPFTAVVMLPGIRKLLKAEEDAIVREKMGQEVNKGLQDWGRQNLIRGVFSFSAAVIGIATFAS